LDLEFNFLLVIISNYLRKLLGVYMLEVMIKFFVSGFVYTGATPTALLCGIGMGIVFGVVWLTDYWPPLFRNRWLWAVLAGGAFLSWAAVALVQIPLQAYTGQALAHFWRQEILMRWLLLAGIPQILLSGLVQEGSKLVPVVVYWWRSGKAVNSRTGLVIGAVSGAGLGTFEAVWVHNTVFASGWNWQIVPAAGILALAPFWERFFTVAFHIGVSALAGYGWYQGKGWQFYLIAAFLHGALNYGVVLMKSGIMGAIHLEIYVAAIAVIVTAIALWLRWTTEIKSSVKNPTF
jgi:hypothetical protein